MPTRVIEARRDQRLHAELAHVAQGHRGAGWVLGVGGHFPYTIKLIERGLKAGPYGRHVKADC